MHCTSSLQPDLPVLWLEQSLFELCWDQTFACSFYHSCCGPCCRRKTPILQNLSSDQPTAAGAVVSSGTAVGPRAHHWTLNSQVITFGQPHTAMHVDIQLLNC